VKIYVAAVEVVHVGAVKIYVAAVEALVKFMKGKSKHYYQLGGQASIHPQEE
jgi:hypothetical protein